MKLTKPNTVVTALIVLVCAAAAIGQDANHTKYDADKTLRSNARVNPSTLAMELSIPLPSYPGRAGNAVASSLEYSSKVWSSGSTAHYSTFLGSKTQIDPTFAMRSASGWTSTMGVPMIDETIDGYTEGGLGWTYDAELPESADFPIVYVKRVRIVMPDGSTHEMRSDDGFHSYGTAFSPYVSEADKRSGVFLSVDGSRMRLEWTQTGTAWTNVLYMPDGGRFLNVPLFNAPSGTVDYFDRSGNKMSYSIANNQWTDTMGRTLTNPIPVYGESYNATVGTPTFNYPTMPGHTAQSVQFVWEHLSSQQSTLSYTSTIYCTGNTGNQIPSGAPHLFSHFLSTDVRVCGTSSTFNPTVLTAVILPNGAKYSFHYNVYAEVDRIDYPTGGYERFVYDQMPAVAGNGDINYDQFNRGVADRYVSPDGTSGSEIHWHYEVEKETTSPTTTGPYHVKTFAPDGSWSEQLIADRFNSLSVSFPFDTPGLGKAFETRVYDNTSRNNLLRRTLTSWTYTAGLTIGGVSPVCGAYRDYRPEREVSMIFEPGATDALVSMTETVYDTSGSTDPAYFSSLNAKQTKTYNYKVVSGSTAEGADIGTAALWFSSTDIAAVTESDFLYDSNYKARDITGLVTESRIKDASGSVKAKTQYGYDEGSFVEINPNAMPTAAAGSWIDPTASTQLGSTIGGKRGLPTTVKSFYDIAAGSYIETHGFFDQYGNLTGTRDGRGFNTVTVYDDDYAFAYPTSVITPAPGDGTQGTSTGFTTSTDYDYNTGLPTSMTDANLQQTTMEYSDPLLRPTKVTAPNGQQTITEYGTVGTGGQYASAQRFVHIRSQIDADHWKEGYTWADGLGRGVQTQAIDSGGDIFVDTEYDDMGRTKRTSNPYRSGETKRWTTPAYDQLGRTVSVTSPDSTAVQLAYGLSTSGAVGTTKTVTDQAGKSRRGISDALGRMVRVVEDPSGSALATDYVFDTLGNLRRTIQGSQNRYFMYDSLGRLLYAKQVEQDTNASLVATDPVTGNTQWSVKYQYDADSNITSTTDAKNQTISAAYDHLNRIVLRDYSGMSMPDVSFYYDGTGLGSVPANSNGKTTKVTSSVSESRYTSFDTMGRLLASEQRTTDEQLSGTQAPYAFGYDYDLSGSLIEETYPSGRVMRNVLDEDGQLSQVNSKKDAAHGFWTYAGGFAYNSAGAVTKMQLGNGRWETADYNERLQVTQIGLGSTDATQDLVNLLFEYTGANPSGSVADRNNGSLRKQTIKVPAVGTNDAFDAVQTYSYDPLNRIKDAAESINASQTWKQTFSYDRFGNRNFDTSTSGLTTTLGSCAAAVCNPTVNTADNRFSTGQGYSYDANGAITQDATGQRFGYDAEDRQVEFFKASNGGTTPDATYLFDGEGRRVKKVTATETTIFVYDASSQLVAEYSLSLATTPQVAYLTQDHLGSTRVVTDASGAVTARKDFDAFGEEVASPERIGGTGGNGYDPPSVRQDYTGYQKDEESGLEYALARYYNPGHGRFTSVDPLTASATIRDPQSFNRYSYALNSPYKFTDPLGLSATGTSWQCSNCSEGSVGGGVFGGALESCLIKCIFQDSGGYVQSSNARGEADSASRANQDDTSMSANGGVSVEKGYLKFKGSIVATGKVDATGNLLTFTLGENNLSEKDLNRLFGGDDVFEVTVTVNLPKEVASIYPTDLRDRTLGGGGSYAETPGKSGGLVPVGKDGWAEVPPENNIALGGRRGEVAISELIDASSGLNKQANIQVIAHFISEAKTAKNWIRVNISGTREDGVKFAGFFDININRKPVTARDQFLKKQ